MSDNVELNAGSGGDTIAADDVSGVKYQVVKLAVGGDGSASLASNASPLPISDAGTTLSVDDGGSSLTVDGTVAVSGTVAVTDNSGSLTVDNAALSVTGGGAEASALRVTIATDSTGVLSVDDNGSTISIDDGGGSITVDGTVAVSGTVTVGSHAVTNAGTFATQAAQSGSWTVTAVGSAAEDAAASGNPVLAGGRYDSSARTLETGDVGALAVNASGQLLVEIAAGAGSGGTSAADDADFTDGTTSGTPAMGVYESSPSTVTDGDLGVVGITVNRELKVSVSSYAGSKIDDAAYTAATDIVAVVGGIVTADSVDSGDAGAFAMTTARALHVAVQGTVTVGSHAVTNAGTFATQVDGAALTALQLIDNPIVADDAAFTPGTTSVTMAGFTADEGSTDSVDEGDGGAARMTLDRKVIVTPYVHAAAGGHTAFRSLDVDETEDEVKSSAGKLFWIHAMNMSNGVLFLKVYNAAAAAVTVGTTTPVLTFPVPTMGDTNGAGFAIHFGDAGLAFSTGICFAAVEELADNGTTGAGTNEMVVNAGFI